MLQVKDRTVRTVYADLLGRVGFRVRQLMEHPPAGYRFVSRVRWPDRLADTVIRNDSLWHLRHAVNDLLPVNFLMSYGPLRLKKPPAGVVLTYSESSLVFRHEPWVVGVEVATQFAGYDHHHLRRYRRFVERALGSPQCRAIVCWSEAARQSIRKGLQAEGFSQKLYVVHSAGRPQKFVKPMTTNGWPVRILFVSSVVTPGGFEIKGGREVLAAFRVLRERYPQVELIVRCDLDEERKRKYGSMPGLHLLTEAVPAEELERLFQMADIFWYPAHSLSSVVVVEAMSYGLPVVTTNYYDNAEFIDDGRTGMVIPRYRSLPPWDTSPAEVRKALRTPDTEFVRALVEKTALLIENPAWRRQLGRAAREEVERGKFSLEQKNRRLKAILDAATDGLTDPRLSGRTGFQRRPRESEWEYVNCGLCGADDTRLLAQARDTLLGGQEVFSIVECQQCGLAYLNPRPTRQAMARYYPADYFNELSGGTVTTSSTRRVFKNILMRLTGGIARKIERLPRGRMLDVGCGDGRYLAFFRDLGWEAYGVDPSPVAIARARTRGLNVSPPGELVATQFPAQYFDLVVLRYTIENMHHPRATLREVHRVLKDEGKLFVSAPSIASPVARVFKQYCAYVEAPRHLYFFTPATLPAMLDRAGFRVVEAVRVAWPAMFRDVVNRLTRGRYRRLLAHTWVSRGVWLAGVPPSLLLAYVGLNRGNMEIIAEKSRPGEA